MTALPPWLAALGDGAAPEPEVKFAPEPPPYVPELRRLPARVERTDAQLAPLGPATRADKLDRLVDKALVTLEETLDTPLSRDDEDFARVLSVKTSAAQGVVNMQLKADENAFRAKSQDGLLSLLQTVLAKEQDLGPVIDG